MIDSDFYLQPLLAQYFLNTTGAANRTTAFLRFDPRDTHLTI
jgi:hypothetical protein